MAGISKPVRIISVCLVAVGIILFVLNILMDGKVNIALPLVFLVLGAGFFILVFILREKWKWASILYVPGSVLIAFGIIFLLNVTTNDWKSWAYAWLLLFAGIGVGLVLASQRQNWRPVVNLVGWGMAAAGVTFFAVFGAIAGGVFIQVMAPILLVLAGVSMLWLPWNTILPESLKKQFHLAGRNAGRQEMTSEPQPLTEPLSSREVEVLRLIDQGLSNQQIALRLSIAPSTVKTHINNLYGKLGVQTRVQAVNAARNLKLLN